MKIIRVGIIGQGRSGWAIHGATLSAKLRDCYQIAAVCDAREDRCREAREATGCAVHTDYRALLADASIDLIVNATASAEHEKVNIEALESGHNVLCEKPLARTAAGVDRQIAAARKAGRLLLPFQQSRFKPAFVLIRELVASGVFGRIVMARFANSGFARRWDWQTLQANNAGNLLNTGPHPLDQALTLFGHVDPEFVHCNMDRTDNTSGDAEDHVLLQFGAKGRPTMELEISSCASFPPPLFTIYGTRGGLAGNDAKLEWKYFRPSECPPRPLQTDPLPDRQYCSENLSWYKGVWECSDTGKDFNAPAVAFYRNIHKTLTEGAAPEVTVEQVRRQIAIIEECHRQNPLPPREA